jgi:hypothetical protein
MAAASEPETLRDAVHAALSDPAVKNQMIEDARGLVGRMFGDSHGVTGRVADRLEIEIRRNRTN